MSGLSRALRSVGLEIAGRTHLGFFLSPAFALVKKWNRRLGDVPKGTRQRIVAQNMRRFRDLRFVDFVMKLEQRLRPHFYYPFGIRCVAICHKDAPGASKYD
jgi:hypothetical protein